MFDLTNSIGLENQYFAIQRTDGTKPENWHVHTFYWYVGGESMYKKKIHKVYSELGKEPDVLKMGIVTMLNKLQLVTHTGLTEEEKLLSNPEITDQIKEGLKTFMKKHPESVEEIDVGVLFGQDEMGEFIPCVKEDITLAEYEELIELVGLNVKPLINDSYSKFKYYQLQIILHE